MTAKPTNYPRPSRRYRVMQAVMGPVMKLFGLSCRAAYELNLAKLDRTLTFGESFRLRLHMLMCGVCRKIPAQLKNLQDCTRKACQQQDQDHADSLSDETLPDESKTRIAETLEKTR